ncbi:MAG TPA: type I phosphomannose isomerase catalytic subunit [Candidatus Baltobacteraceae bacterium]|jgi:mannose-6-phosphate isomerase|nr:type I phosphomannose isomerase catalytic subunit [Candidatus Baltobacteraceae bacterium]
MNTTLPLLEPIFLKPRLVPLIWGGDALVRRYGKQGDPAQSIGESWECWDDNVVREGRFAGSSLAQIRVLLGQALMGRLDPTAPFPLLSKFIDARQALSVQVHPDDEYARRVEGKANGKTECWYVLEASSNAELVLGWTRDVSREEYLKRVGDGSLEELLRRVPVAPGDVFYLPAGTLHAIGAGIILFELQQSSDLTYRIFDWNRLGLDGKPRELHVQKAADVLDYRAGHDEAINPLTFVDGSADRSLLIVDSHFLLERVRLGRETFIPEGDRTPLVLQTLQHACTIIVDGKTFPVPPYTSAIVPAAASCGISASDERDVSVLLAKAAPDRERLLERTVQAGIAREDAEEFFARFGWSGVRA